MPRRSRPSYPFLLTLLIPLIAMGVVIGRAARNTKTELVVMAKSPRIVSLLPQATEIIVSIGCGDHLAAVSNYDADPRVAHLPRVGDYQTIDWETIAQCEPGWIVTHYGNWHTPTGFIERAQKLGIERLNVVTETL